MGSWVLTTAMLVLVLVLVIVGDINVMSSAKVDYITWEDMKVDRDVQQRMREEQNGGQVVVVDRDGNGDSVTVQGAVDMVTRHNSQRIKILILPGIYKEKVFVPKNKPYISFIGDINRNSETKITWNDKASDKGKDGSELGTIKTATVNIESNFFCTAGLTIENSAGYGSQAVALKVAADNAMFYRVRVLGEQDTLLDDSGSHYFYQSYIEGSVDFIFGSARSLYQDCVLHSTAKNDGAIVAHRRDSEDEETGFSFVNCKISGRGSIYLGRAWGDYSRVIYSYCDMDNVIDPAGWSDWNQPSRQKTAVFGEYKCRGKGADRKKRVLWSISLSREKAKPFLDMKFIAGQKWLRL